MLVVPLGKLLDRCLDRFYAALLTHLLSREVGVAASAVPVSLKWLGVERDLDIELFGDTS